LNIDNKLDPLSTRWVDINSWKLCTESAKNVWKRNHKWV